MIRHNVVFEIKPGVSQEAIDNALKLLFLLQKKLPGFLRIAGGKCWKKIKQQTITEGKLLMNFKLLGKLSIVSMFLCQSSFALQQTMTFKNQRGSILELNFLPDHKIDGYFTTAVASKSCPQAINQKRPINGFVVGNAMTFSVVYPMCGSVLSVTGNFMKKQKSIDTISVLNKQADDVAHEGPGARFIGHDFYEKLS